MTGLVELVEGLNVEANRSEGSAGRSHTGLFGLPSGSWWVSTCHCHEAHSLGRRAALRRWLVGNPLKNLTSALHDGDGARLRGDGSSRMAFNTKAVCTVGGRRTEATDRIASQLVATQARCSTFTSLRCSNGSLRRGSNIADHRVWCVPPVTTVGHGWH